MGRRIVDGEDQPNAMSASTPFGPPLTHRVDITDSSVHLPLRFRSSNWVVVILATGLMVLLFSAFFFEPVVDGRSGNGAGRTSAERVGLAITVAIGWLVFLRVLRARLVLGARHITIRNFVRTHRVAWPDVRHVALVRRVGRSKGGATVTYTKVYIVAETPIAVSAALVNYANRAAALKPVIDICHSRNVAVYDT